MAHANGLEDLAPVDYPRVYFGAKSVCLKYNLGARLRLERQGFGPERLKEYFANPGQFPLTLMFTMLAACAGTPQSDGTWKPEGHSAEEWADAVPEDKFKDYADAVGLALKKALSESKPGAPTKDAAQLPAN